MKPLLMKSSLMMLAGLALAQPVAALAQLLPYEDLSGALPSGGDDSANGGLDQGDRGAPPPRVNKAKFSPYVEGQLVAQTQLSPHGETLTYSTLAAGVDAALSRRNAEGGLSLRYERRFGLGGSKVRGSDTLSGLTRGSVNLIPGALAINASAVATQTGVENNGSSINGVRFGNNVGNVYSVTAGPSVQTRVGNVGLQANYQAGYTKVSTPTSIANAAGQSRVDLFRKSVSQVAGISAEAKPRTLLPVGLSAGLTWSREDSSTLDQRTDDKHARAGLVLPIGGTVQVLGGVGYEKVMASNRDAVIDPVTKQPKLDAHGQYVINNSQPRKLAYRSDGLTWDAGVMWRPGPRTSLEARIARRYGSISYTGSLTYASSNHSSLNVSIYDNIGGFGGKLNEILRNLPINGLEDCTKNNVTGVTNNSRCLNGGLASLRSSSFRGRGVAARFGVNRSRFNYGLAAGYDNYKYIGASSTALAYLNGKIDQSYWLSAYLNGQIDRASSFGTNVWTNWFESGDKLAGNTTSLGATASYYRSLSRNLTANAMVGVEGVNRQSLPDYWSASGQVGLRYAF